LVAAEQCGGALLVYRTYLNRLKGITRLASWTKAEKILWVILPSNEDPTLPLNPRQDSCEEPFDRPSPCVSQQSAFVLRSRLAAIASVRSDHLDAVLTQLLIQRFAVVGAISNQIFGLASIM